MSRSGLIEPHGGMLINRIQPGLIDDPKVPSIVLTERQQCDLEMIGIGAMSPLMGFVSRDEFDCICSSMQLTGDTAWPIPITCAVDRATANGLKEGDRVALRNETKRLLGYLTVTEKYPHDKAKAAKHIYRTEDVNHPGVKVLMEEGDVCLAGPVEVAPLPKNTDFAEYRLTPAQTRAEFERRGWKTVVAFQTRNPIHRAHEYLTKCAQEVCDGLLIHPLIGQTQPGDIPAEVRMQCYQILIEKYYNPKRTMLSVMPAAMRYAGPREAILHALIRQNYGCSHFIVGRDHAGVGDYYGTYDAQQIFDEFKPGEIHITPLKFEHAGWSVKLGGMASFKTSPYGSDDWIFLSGKKVRQMLADGQCPPPEFTRPEVAEILVKAAAQQNEG